MIRADLLIVGGGTGGCAAAMAAVSLGLRVILTEETDWIGGQFTAQGVPADEHPWIEEFGCTRRYREFRNRVRAAYRRRPLTAEAMANPHLNPGGGWVSRLCCEPAIAHNVFREMTEAENLTILLRRKPVGATVDGDRVESVTLWNLETGEDETLAATTVLDATELGDLLKLAQVEYVSGAESKRDSGEPNAVDGDAQPGNVQGLTWCFAMQWGESTSMAKPDQYERWRGYRPSFWPGPLLGFEVLHAHTGEKRTLPLFREDGDWYALFPYRKIVDPSITTVSNLRPVTLVNWPQNDYFEGNVIDVDPPGSRSAFPGASGPVSEERVRESIQLSLSLLYWLRTEAPRHDGGEGYPECSPAFETFGGSHPLGEFGFASAFAKYPYIRESRRIVARTTVREQDVAAYTNPGRDRVVPLDDSVGVGAYRIDLHPSTSGANTIDTSTIPFQIPLGCLIPVRMRNLLPACKNVGTTHITNGCFRLHPVEWNIGEASGLLASFCFLRGVEPSQVFENASLRFDYQRLLVDQGIELAWPDSPLHAL